MQQNRENNYKVGDIVKDKTNNRRAIVFVPYDKEVEMTLIIYTDMDRELDPVFYVSPSDLSYVESPVFSDIEKLIETKNNYKEDIFRRHKEGEWDYKTTIKRLNFYRILWCNI